MGGWPLLVRVALSLLITNITFLFINNFLKNTKATLMVWKNIIKYIMNVALLFFGTFSVVGPIKYRQVGSTSNLYKV